MGGTLADGVAEWREYEEKHAEQRGEVMADRQQMVERLRNMAIHLDLGEKDVLALEAGASALAREQEMVEALKDLVGAYEDPQLDDPHSLVLRAKAVLDAAEIPHD